MPYFKDQREMQDIQRAFFDRVASDAKVGPQLRAAGLIIRFQFHDPSGSVTIDGRSEGGEGRHFAEQLLVATGRRLAGPARYHQRPLHRKGQSQR